MKFDFCPKCGNKLIEKQIGDEGLIPYCNNCSRPWFSFCYTCVICLLVDENENIALIKQSYGDTNRYVCVAGFMKPGESAEEAAMREIYEETGLKTIECKYVNSYPYEKKDNLMLGFACKVTRNEFKLSSELSQADWFTKEEALMKLADARIAKMLLEDYING